MRCEAKTLRKRPETGVIVPDAVACRPLPTRHLQSTRRPEEWPWDRGKVRLAEVRLTAAAPYTWTPWAVATSA